MIMIWSTSDVGPPYHQVIAPLVTRTARVSADFGHRVVLTWPLDFVQLSMNVWLASSLTVMACYNTFISAISTNKAPCIECILSGWWFGICCYFSIQLGMSSSQLTNSYFSEGVAQPPTSKDEIRLGSSQFWPYGILWPEIPVISTKKTPV